MVLTVAALAGPRDHMLAAGGADISTTSRGRFNSPNSFPSFQLTRSKRSVSVDLRWSPLPSRSEGRFRPMVV